MAKIINKIWNAVKGLPLDVKSRSVIAEALTKAETNEGGGGGDPVDVPGFGTPVASAIGVANTAPAKATVDASGPDTAKVFTFTFEIPKGDTGDPGAPGSTGKTPVMEIGTVTTIASGGNATANVTANGLDGSGNPKYKIDLGIPKGADGGAGSRGGRLLIHTADTTGAYRPAINKNALFPTQVGLVVGDLIVDKVGNYREITGVSGTGNAIGATSDILITIPIRTA